MALPEKCGREVTSRDGGFCREVLVRSRCGSETRGIGTGDDSPAWMPAYHTGPAGCRAVQAAGQQQRTPGRTMRPSLRGAGMDAAPCCRQRAVAERRRHDAAGAPPLGRARMPAAATHDAPHRRHDAADHTARCRPAHPAACAARCRTPARSEAGLPPSGRGLPPCEAQHLIERHDAASTRHGWPRQAARCRAP